MFYLSTTLEPVALNAAYRRRGYGGGMYMIDEGKNFKLALFLKAKEVWKNDLMVGDLEGFLTITRPNRRSDSDSYEKLIWDALQKVVYKNDRQIRSHHVKMLVGEPRIEITVKPLASDD